MRRACNYVNVITKPSVGVVVQNGGGSHWSIISVARCKERSSDSIDRVKKEKERGGPRVSERCYDSVTNQGETGEDLGSLTCHLVRVTFAKAHSRVRDDIPHSPAWPTKRRYSSNVMSSRDG